ncbi:hypothetical protein LCGC14_2004360, partial [marine sediment metagenome]
MTERVDILIRARDAFSQTFGKATKGLKNIKISAAGMRSALAATALAVAGVTVALVKMFKIGSGVLETQSKFNTVFGESASKVDKFAKSFGKLAGLTQSEAQNLLATTGAIVQGMGFATDASADFAQEVIRLAGDLQSFNDVPIAQTARAIQSALTGERESLKTLGIVIKEVDVQQRAMAISGKENAKALTNQEKAAATMELIVESAGVAIGDLNRTQTSAANQARIVAGEFKQIAENVSVDLIPALESILPVLKAIGEAIAPVASKFSEMAIAFTDATGFTSATFRAEAPSIRALKPEQLAGRRKQLAGEVSDIVSQINAIGDVELDRRFERIGLQRELNALSELIELVESLMEEAARAAAAPPTVAGPGAVGGGGFVVEGGAKGISARSGLGAAGLG